MREMKDSGISWVGEIPKEWKCLPIRALFTENRNKNFLGKETKALQFKYGTIIPKKNFDPEENYVAETILNYNIVDRGMIMLNGLNLNFDFVSKRIALVTERGIITSAYMSFYPTDTTTVLSEYSNYLLKSYDNCAAFHNMGGGVRKILNFDELKRQYFILPSLVEQQRIAEFLDRECGKIDGLKADIQAQIDTLEQYKRSIITEAVTHGLNPSAPMKDSGIPWVGQFPTHWTKKKGKYILRYMSKPVKQDDGVITCFRDGEVTLRSNRREDGFTMADKEIGYQGVDVGDLVVHGMDGFAGAIGISDSRGKASPVLNVLNTKQNKKYIMYYLRSMAYGEVFTALSTGIRVRSCDLRWNKLAELLYPLPPIDEQNNIVNYIDEQIARTNEIIADKKLQIETLDGYKKSLIFEYVTGKKEIAL